MEDLLDWMVNNDRAIAWSIIIYFFFVAPFEIAVHELSHFYFQRKFGIQLKYIQIGCGEIFRISLEGIPLIFGLFPGYGCSMAVGEGPEAAKEALNPKSASYIHRHPRERLIVAIAGPLATLAVFTVIFAGLQSYGMLTGLALPPFAYVALAMIYFTEITNLLIPFKVGGYPSDALYAYQAIYDWCLWKPKDHPK